MQAKLHIFRVLAAGWMALIFLLSSQPRLPVPMLFNGMDKLAHVLCYGILVFLLARSLVPPEVTSGKRVLLLTILVTAYGMTDEFHQSLVPGRDASAWDVMADGAGGLVVAWTMHWRYRRTVGLS